MPVSKFQKAEFGSEELKIKKSMLDRKFIPERMYRNITEVMPICCVDIVFKAKGKVYLFKRAYQPAKGIWWLVGGRILKGEHLNDATIRKAKEEIGVDIRIKKMIGVYEIFLRPGYFDSKKEAHAISVCFLAEPKSNNFKLKLNEEYTSYKTITKIGMGLHPYVKAVLKDSKAI